MRSINTDVLSALAAEELRPFLLLEMTIDGTTYRYTNCDVPINYNGNTYEPIGMQVGSIRYNSTGMVDGFDITLDNLNSVLTSIFVGGTPQGSPVILRQVLMDNDWHILGQPWGLVAAYDFDEGSGTTLHDRSGNGNDGTIYGDPTWASGVSGHCLDFDASGDYVNLPSSIPLSSSYVTACAWAKVASHGDYHNFVRNNWVNSGWLLYSSVNYWNFGIAQGGTSYLARYNHNNNTDWVFLAGVYDGSQVKLYVNAELVATKDLVGATLDTGYQLRIGRPDPPSEYWIDEVRIYDRALSDAEISYLYNNPGQDMSAGAIILFNGQIDKWSLDESQLVMTIADMNVQWARKPLSRHPASCRWRVFKGPECGYTGSETWCDRSYARCSALGNTANFGGFRWLPSIMDKEIWWGRQPKS